MFLLEDKRNIDYRSFLSALKEQDSKAILLLQLRNWLFSVLEFDPNTGDPLLSDMTSFLDKVSGLITLDKEELEEKNINKFDWLYKSLSYNRRSLLYLLENPRNEIIRSHERMNIYQAREIDSAGIMEISRRPGRTVREKIAVKPTILAVKREQGTDTLENRLLKKYLVRLVNILDERQKCFDELENEDSTLPRLYSIIRRWLKTDEADRIGKWQNLPPNNILLHDKNYKKIWRGWQFLLDMDEMVLDDWNDIERFLSIYIFWKTLSILQSNGSKILQSPLKFDYNKFEICNIPFESSNCIRVEAENYALEMKGNKITVTSKEGKEHGIEIHFNKLIIGNKVISESLVTLSDADKVSLKLAHSIDKITEKRTIPASFDEEQKYTAINFSEFPYKSVSFSNSDKFESREFSSRLTRQFWTANTETDWINLETSNSPTSYSDSVNDYKIETVSFEDVFFDSENQVLSEEKLSSAAYDFMNSIRAFYNTNTLYYLLPDYLEDFSLSRIRSTANTVFPSANPVPNSIGVVCAFHQSDVFKNCSVLDNDFVFVIEKSGDNKVFSITPIQAKTTFEMSNQKLVKLSEYSEIPYGIRWEHHPAVIFENYEPAKVMEYIKTAISQTEGLKKSSKVIIISSQKSIGKARLEISNENWVFINTPYDAANGAAFCAHIQDKVKDIPMWSEHLPILKMTYLKNGKRSGSNLTYGKTVLPIRGQRQRIEIPERFVLNKNVKTYHFRLSRGGLDTSNSLRYEACLNNSAFPLKTNTKCHLEMYYIYGEEQPFELYFVPANSSEFIRAKVEWRKIDENAFPVPNFPPIRSWSEFENWENVRTKEKSDLVVWNIDNFKYINELQKFCLGEDADINRYTISIPSMPKVVQNGNGRKYYSIPFEVSRNVLINIQTFRKLDNDNPCIKISDLSFSIDKKKSTSNYVISSNLTIGRTLHPSTFKSIGRRLRFPSMQIWNNRNSIFTADTSKELSKSVLQVQESLRTLLENNQILRIPSLWNELMLLACVMHSDGLRIASGFIRKKLTEKIDFSQRRQEIELLCYQFGYFIGDAGSSIQKEVYEWVLDFNEDMAYEMVSFKLQILTISLWRNEQLLKKISYAQMEQLFSKVINAIQHEFDMNKELENNMLSNGLLNPLRSHLELLCALIRSREMGSSFQELFSPFSSEIQTVISLIEQIYIWLKPTGKILFTKQIKFTSLDVDSGTQFLDYLLSWLDGENSSEMPKIESATENVPDDSDEETINEK